VTFAFVFDAGPFRVRKYESVVIGFDIRVEVVSGEQKANLLDSRLCCWLINSNTSWNVIFEWQIYDQQELWHDIW